MTAVDPDYPLPTIEELTMPELELSSPVLKASAHHFGKVCDWESKEFMLCMDEEKDPTKCLKEGAAVTNCGWKFFNQIRTNCMKEFTDYYTCVDHARSGTYLERCRKTQNVFDTCVLNKLGWERPALGYYSRVRLHDTDRPKPKEPVGKVPEWTPGPSEETMKVTGERRF